MHRFFHSNKWLYSKQATYVDILLYSAENWLYLGNLHAVHHRLYVTYA